MFMLKFIVFVVITIGIGKSAYARGHCSLNDNEVIFYQSIKFSGKCRSLGIGTYMNSKEMRVKNDSVSSIRVGKNVQVMVCKHASNAPKGSGWFENPRNCERFVSSKIRLGGSRIGNDSISSAKIVKKQAVYRAPGRCYPGDNSKAIAVYQHPNLGGKCRILGVGDYNNSRVMKFKNDTISSIEFGKNSKIGIKACRDRNLWGRCESFRATDLNLRDNRIGDNTITSIRVDRLSGL